MVTSAAKRAKPVFAFVVSAVCLWVLSQQITAVTWDSLWQAIQSIAPWQWTIAGLATLCSFIAIGEYDVIWHRHLKTAVSARKARTTGMSTVAIAQTVGLGSVTGTFLRWHMLDPLPLKSAAAVTIGVCLSFLGCWAVIAAVAAAVTGTLPALAILGGLLALVGGLMALRQHPLLAPHLRLIPAFMGLAFLDVLFAAIALWVLLPDPGAVGFPLLFAAFVLALGAGLISNAPGGLGAFELVLLSVLTTVAEPALVAAVLSFRLVYYLIPALCGGAVLLAAQLRGTTPTPGLNQAPQSDLCRQGAALKTAGATRYVARQHLLGTVALEPATWNFDIAPQSVGFMALYKCHAPTASVARQRGWTVRRIASDAVITPQSWSTQGAKRSQLRRKLRQAEKAGVTIIRAGRVTPDAAMDRVAKAWETTHGGELGYAMGRYTHAYVAQQQCYLIYDNQTLCGFVTVQTRAQAWVIDLIRHLPQMPQGAMHAAMTRIIEDAAAAYVASLSMGAVPDGPDDNPLQRACAAQKKGLRQFKAAFGPHWQPRYHAAPTRAQFALSLALAFWHIQRPLPRTWLRLRKTITNLINIERIIHLIHIKERDISSANTENHGAPADDQSTLNATG